MSKYLIFPFVPLAFLAASEVQSPEWAPFTAIVLRTSRTVYEDGRAPLVEQIREVYRRSSNGSLRRENWKSTNGAVANPPAFVTLHDASGRVYHIHETARKVEWIRDQTILPRDNFQVNPLPGQPVETHHGQRCAVLKSVFLNAQRERIASGTACRSLDLGMVIHERMVIPHPKGGASVYWEADLVQIDWQEPPSALMQIPADYPLMEVTLPAMACTTCTRN